jgi:hypothetical protein
MRYLHTGFILAGILLAGSLAATAQTKYGVKVETSKAAGLTAARNYVWVVGRPSPDKDVDRMVVAAIDRELAAHGLAKQPAAPGDLAVTYTSLNRTDVNVSTSTSQPASVPFAVGTLVIDISNPTTKESLYRVRMDTPIDRDPAKLEAEIGAAVKEMFGTYPQAARR